MMDQWHCIVAGQQYGPVAFDLLRNWAGEGRLNRADYVWTDGMPEWVEARRVAGLFGEGPAATPGVFLKPHRGPVILALGIIGALPPLFVCGIVAWVLANRDLRDMQARRMDASGRAMTRAGKICGIIGVCLSAAFLCLYVLIFVGCVLRAF